MPPHWAPASPPVPPAALPGAAPWPGALLPRFGRRFSPGISRTGRKAKGALRHRRPGGPCDLRREPQAPDRIRTEGEIALPGADVSGHVPESGDLPADPFHGGAHRGRVSGVAARLGPPGAAPEGGDPRRNRETVRGPPSFPGGGGRRGQRPEVPPPPA